MTTHPNPPAEPGATSDRQPTGDGLSLVLIADDQAERTRWLTRLLEGAGYAVLRERVGQHVRERARFAQPDLIVLAPDLPDVTGVELSRQLRADARISSSTPIFLLVPEPATRELRLAALRAGAWEVITPPHEPDELLLRVDTYVRAKRDADRTGRAGLLDPQTGLYNRLGLARRARELGSQAFRDHGALACVVLALDVEATGGASPDARTDSALARSVQRLEVTARRSDVIGALGPAEFAVLAPGTDATGARRLAERLAGSLEVAAGSANGSPGTLVRVRCGYEAVANLGYTPIEPAALLARAATALRTGRAETGGWVRRYAEGPAAASSPSPSPSSPSSGASPAS
jgi:diguanylate cyclase (GGDEF)-like protein